MARKALELREAQFKAVEAQQARGQATFQALLEAQASLAQAQADTLQAELSWSLAKARLDASLGTQVEPFPLSLPQTPPTLDEALAARERRPDVQKARLALEEAEALLAQARRDRFFPSVSLGVSVAEGPGSLGVSLDLKTGQLGYSLQYSSGTSQSQTSLQLQASLPLLQPSQDAALALREGAVEQARRNLANALVAAELDLRSKHQALRQVRGQLEVVAKSLQAAENSLDNARRRLEAGTGTILEVKQAELGLLQAQRAWEGARAELLQAYYALLDAMGESLLGGEE